MFHVETWPRELNTQVHVCCSDLDLALKIKNGNYRGHASMH
jgi:hypothetical protein